MEVESSICLSDLVPALRWSRPQQVAEVLGDPRLPAGWWSSLALSKALGTAGLDWICERLARLASSRWDHLPLTDLLPALTVHRIDPALPGWPEPTRTAITGLGGWQRLRRLSPSDLTTPSATPEVVMGAVFREILGRIPAQREAPGAGHPEVTRPLQRGQAPGRPASPPGTGSFPAQPEGVPQPQSGAFAAQGEAAAAAQGPATGAFGGLPQGQSGPFAAAEGAAGPRQTGSFPAQAAASDEAAGGRQTGSSPQQPSGDVPGVRQTGSFPAVSEGGPGTRQTGSFPALGEGAAEGRQTGSFPAQAGPPSGQSGPFPTQAGPPSGQSGPFPTQAGPPSGQSGPFPTQAGPPSGQSGPFPTQAGSSPEQSGSFPEPPQGGGPRQGFEVLPPRPAPGEGLPQRPGEALPPRPASAEPGLAGQSAHLSQPGQPGQPAQPSQPGQPGRPSQPTQSAQPVQSAPPAQPSQPERLPQRPTGSQPGPQPGSQSGAQPGGPQPGAQPGGPQSGPPSGRQDLGSLSTGAPAPGSMFTSSGPHTGSMPAIPGPHTGSMPAIPGPDAAKGTPGGPSAPGYPPSGQAAPSDTDHAMVRVVDNLFRSLDKLELAVAVHRLFAEDPVSLRTLAHKMLVDRDALSQAQRTAEERVLHWLRSSESAPVTGHMFRLTEWLGAAATEDQLVGADPAHPVMVPSLRTPLWRVLVTLMPDRRLQDGWLVVGDIHGLQARTRQLLAASPPDADLVALMGELGIRTHSAKAWLDALPPETAASDPAASAPVPAQPLPRRTPGANGHHHRGGQPIPAATASAIDPSAALATLSALSGGRSPMLPGGLAGAPATPPPPLPSPSSDPRRWQRIEVTPEHLRGGPVPVPEGYAAQLGMRPGTLLSVTGPGDNAIVLVWQGHQPVFDSLQPVLMRLNARPGDQVYVTVDGYRLEAQLTA
ncbi:hypothetical protein GCM10022224_051950 [Nonomuraea antimicrobica]|uniref:Uncharacterized protein n=1 Tax=Nonomuraea antimicrobica TaxID=561173 RepID=A0ABP7C8V0_9ACTN